MSEANSSNPPSPWKDKPERPEGSPLFWHASGRWAKKIKGKLHYFGRGSHEDALAAYLADAEDLHAGRLPRAAEEGTLTVYQLCAKFLVAKKQQLADGELAPTTLNAYAEICRLLWKVLGRGRAVSDLRPPDFAKLRAKMAETWGPERLKSEIVRARTPFNWAYGEELIDRPVRFGASSFSVPRQKMFEADEIRSMLDTAKQPLKSMILLGINAGLSNGDIAAMPIAALDLKRGWLDYPRVKTGNARRIPLWPETVASLEEWLEVRPEPMDEKHAALVFVTDFRRPWMNTALSHEVRKLLDKLKIDGKRNYYGLRHALQTIGDESGDFIAVRRIMGHASKDIADVYRDRISDERLRAVTECVRAWLFAKPADGEKETTGKKQSPAAQAQAEPKQQPIGRPVLRLFAG
jgi:integrase